MTLAARASALNELFDTLSREDVPPDVLGMTAPVAAPAECRFHGDSVLREFVRSFLLWDAPIAPASAALLRIEQETVDINEFRVWMIDEIVAILGPRYPRVHERAAHLRAALQEVYRREHRLRLSHLAEMPKREARAYLESIEHAPQFVSARVLLLCLGAHAFPLDDRSLGALVRAGILQKDTPLADAASWLERTVRAGEGLRSHQMLLALAERKTPAGQTGRLSRPSADSRHRAKSGGSGTSGRTRKRPPGP